MIMGLLGNALPALIPYVVARCYCVDKPIASDFLSDKGQKSNDKVADLFPRERCQAGVALEIREGWALGFHQPPTLFPALELESQAATGCTRLAIPKAMNKGTLGKFTNAYYLVPTVHQRSDQVLYLCSLS